MVRFYPECRRARRTLTRLCRRGASAPLFVPLCVLYSSALSSLRLRFCPPLLGARHPASPVYPELRREPRRGRSNLRIRPWRKESTVPTATLSSCKCEQDKSKQPLYYQQHKNTHSRNSFRIMSLQIQGGVFSYASFALRFPKWDSQSWLSSCSFQRLPAESRPQ
jgi:hypothetical protein